MHVVPVRIGDLEAGELPPVCVKTGEPADELVKASWFVTPAWILIGLPFGILPYLILRSMHGRTVHGMVPVSSAVLRDMTRLGRIRNAAVVVGVAAVVAGLAFDAPLGIVGGFTALVTAAGAGMYASLEWIGVLPGDSPNEVLLTRVSAEFARGVRAPRGPAPPPYGAEITASRTRRRQAGRCRARGPRSR